MPASTSTPAGKRTSADAEELLAEADELQRTWRLDDAEARIREALDRGAPDGRARYQLSIVLAQQGLGPEGLLEAGKSLLADPWARAAWHNFLSLCKLDHTLEPDLFLDLHREFGVFFTGNEDVLHLQVERTLDRGRPLRVGYLSPNAHLAMNRFLAPFLAHFDPTTLQVFAYWGGSIDLAAVRSEFPAVAHRSVNGLSDADVAQQLLADRIDIAVDLVGHGAFNQLFALQRRPAPIQATWLDYLATTGLPAMDYRLSDWTADPESNDRFHTERLARLGCAPWCYSPWPEVPESGVESPVEHNGHVTFGGFVAALKLGERTLTLWRDTLQANPDARLLVVGVPGTRARERILAFFGPVLAHRIEIRPRLGLPEYLAALDEVDIALDSHPFSGATSTLDCLWQGVPVVTLAGVLPFSRSTASINVALGLRDLVACDVSAFVHKASSLADDRTRLRALRSTLRSLVRKSPLGDPDAFSCHLEACFRDLWSRYVDSLCNTHDPFHGQPSGFVPNHQAEAMFRSAQRARGAGNVAVAKALYRSALEQLPGLRSARKGYWELVVESAAR
jgi:hypothetical protein